MSINVTDTTMRRVTAQIATSTSLHLFTYASSEIILRSVQLHILYNIEQFVATDFLYDQYNLNCACVNCGLFLRDSPKHSSFDKCSCRFPISN